jgi:hypothetical protein
MKAPRAQGSRKAKPKARGAKAHRLKREFDEAHKLGMAGLKRGDYVALEQAIAKERVILKEQAELIDDSRRAFRQRPRAKRKARKKR